jgi:hypothetical protein
MEASLPHGNNSNKNTISVLTSTRCRFATDGNNLGGRHSEHDGARWKINPAGGQCPFRYDLLPHIRTPKFKSTFEVFCNN